MAKAAKCTIAEVEEIVPVGSIDPDQIHLPGVYVHRLIKGEKYEKRIEKLTLSSDSDEIDSADSPAAKRRERIVRRAAKEFKDGDYANLGIGMPMAASNYVEPGVTLKLQR
jgi:3-oxoacid CoA-transferase